jgi:redox-sensitive bicupin YhaK (pirin superfamily)
MLGARFAQPPRDQLVELRGEPRAVARAERRRPARHDARLAQRRLQLARREQAADGQMVLFTQHGEEVRIENPADAQATLDVLIIGGVPLHEPVARYGPFVMNTTAEIYQAIEDYQAGRMGEIVASKGD